MENAKRPNMGEGNVKQLLFKMALPAVLAQLVNLLYNIVDRIYIGHMPGVGGDALTGVGLFTPILMLITAFAMLCGAGGAPQAGIALGQGNKEKAETLLRYWQFQERAHYPNAKENVEYFKRQVDAERRAKE